MTTLGGARRLLVIPLAAIALAGCADGDGGGDGDGDGAEDASGPTTSVSPTTTQAVGELADDRVRAELVEQLSQVFADVRSGPVAIELELDEGAGPSVATIRVDRPAGLIDSTWVQTTRRGSEITSRNLVVGGRAYFKSTDGAAAAEALGFIEIGEWNGTELLDNVFTAYGRVGPSLDRLIVLLEKLPFRASVESVGSTERVTVVFDAAEVFEFYAETGLEQVGGALHEDPMRLTFVIDRGGLAGLEASGTHFHDGEALEIVATISYSAIEPFELEPPPVDD